MNCHQALMLQFVKQWRNASIVRFIWIFMKTASLLKERALTLAVVLDRYHRGIISRWLTGLKRLVTIKKNRCVPVVVLVLHHTVTHSAQETLNILNARGLSVQYIAEKNGTIYQMVHDYYRAWHAGVSYWGDLSDMNSHSVGCEIVNTGDEPFPRAQMDGVINLSRLLISRWHIDPKNIVGHFDIHPTGKNDPSGYFDWKYYYTQLGYYTNIWPSSLTSEQQRFVLMSPSKYDSEQLTSIQQRLRQWGYAGSLKVTGKYDTDTRYVIQAFNRHWCPEVFVPEKVDYNTNATVTNPNNQRWYAISEERLKKLLLTF